MTSSGQKSKLSERVGYYSTMVVLVLGILVAMEFGLGWFINKDNQEENQEIFLDIYSSGIYDEDSLTMQKAFDEMSEGTVVEWNSFTYWKAVPYSGEQFNITPEGFRHTVQPEETDEQTKRKKVFLLGGSTMFGLGVNDAGTIASALANMMARDTLPPVEIYNYGMVAYNSTQELILLMRQIQEGNIPDVVIFYDGFNDIYAAMQNEAAAIPINEQFRKMEFNVRKEPGKVNAIIEERLNLMKLVRKIREKITPVDAAVEQHSLPEGLLEDVVNVYDVNLETANRLGEAYGFDVLSFWQPIPFTKKTKSEREERKVAEFSYQLDFLMGCYDAFKTDSRFNESRGFYDISGVLDDVEYPVYMDFIHLGSKGNRLVAKAMHERLREVMLTEVMGADHGATIHFQNESL